MATFLERNALAQDEEFRIRVKMAMLTAANQILADPERAAEHDFCERLIAEPNQQYFIDQFAYLTVANQAIVEESDDADIQFTVNSIFEKLADGFTGKRKKEREEKEQQEKEAAAEQPALEDVKPK